MKSMYISTSVFVLHDYYVRLKNRIYSLFVKLYLPHASSSCIIYSDTHFKGVSNIWIGDKTVIARYGTITAWTKYGKDSFSPQIIIGNNVSIGEYCHITAISKIVIGDNVLTGRRLTISDNAHGNTSIEEMRLPPASRSMASKGSVTIGRNVWIGENVTILPNVTVGDSAIIGAGSVVTKDIPPFAVVCGNPAKVLKITYNG